METLVINKNYLDHYKGKKVFVTGHTGFKGSWLSTCLLNAGAIVKGYSLAPEYEGLFQLIESSANFESVIADIRDKIELHQAIISFQPDLIFHLAAQPLVRRSYQMPAETFDVNVVGTANLLEVAKELPGKCTLVIITTDKVYENKETGQLYKEEDRLGGYDPYSASKACAELVVSSFRNSFFNANNYMHHHKAVLSVRAGNVIGGGDRSEDRIIPDIIRSLEAEQPIRIRNPNAIRPWQHVLEPLAGYLLLGKLADENVSSTACAYNFGPLPEDHLTVKELATIAIKCWGKGEWIDQSDPKHVHEAGVLKLDITKAQEQLGWQPKLNAADAIRWTVDWYKQPKAAQLDFTKEQIKNYFAL